MPLEGGKIEFGIFLVLLLGVSKQISQSSSVLQNAQLDSFCFLKGNDGWSIMYKLRSARKVLSTIQKWKLLGMPRSQLTHSVNECIHYFLPNCNETPREKGKLSGQTNPFFFSATSYKLDFSQLRKGANPKHHQLLFEGIHKQMV